MSWYRTGTVSVINGNTLVTGASTMFIANSRSGDAFIGPDGKVYEVTNLATETALSIYPPYQGATAAGQNYAIAPMQGYVKASADRLRQAVDDYADKLESLQPWATADTAAEAREDLELGTIATQDSSNVSITGGSATGLSSVGVNGDITFAGSGRKIKGDMSSATISNLLTFQSSAANGYTIFNVAPVGTGNIGGINLYNSQDVNNSSYLGVACQVDHTRISSSKTGSGISLPLYINATVGVAVLPVNIDGSCNLQVANGIKLGNTSNSNAAVLDYYSEAALASPIVLGSGSAGTGTYGSRTGSMTRIGNRVDFTMSMDWSAHSGTGNLRFGGLPFAAASLAAINCTYSGIGPGAGKQLSLRIAAGGTIIIPYGCDPAGGIISEIPMDISGGVTITGTYFV